MTTTILTPGYAAPPHLVYTQHVTTVTPSTAVQAPLPYMPRRDMVPPPPGFAVLAPPPDFECPKSSPLDRPPVAVAVPASSVPARGIAAAPAGPSGQVELGRVATAPAPSWMEDLSAVLKKLAKKIRKKRKVLRVDVTVPPDCPHVEAGKRSPRSPGPASPASGTVARREDSARSHRVSGHYQSPNRRYHRDWTARTTGSSFMGL
ncbi:uncharacterized protein LOC135221272 [Macrobrachium nipponense]|uniref:uncharacterized protein LOC135221272 n=1 Tax=Macrobrachium nipponense TaxID=159736 RepID=UPI0030C8AA03